MVKRIESAGGNYYFQRLLKLTKTNYIMKTNILKITAVSFFAALTFALPVLSHAQDSTNAPAAAPVKSKRGLVFRGTVSAIDTNAMTLTVETRTFNITSETKIKKDGEPATLDEGVVGEPVSGAYKTGDDGKLNATTVHFGGKAGGKKKKETATDTTTTNAGN